MKHARTGRTEDAEHEEALVDWPMQSVYINCKILKGGKAVTPKATLDSWLLIPVGSNDCIFGQIKGTRNFVITSEISAMDQMNPPNWVMTKSGSHYSLATRDSAINRYSSVAVFDTLSNRGMTTEEITRALDAADRINKECASGSTISMIFNRRREERHSTTTAAITADSSVTTNYSNDDRTVNIFEEARRLAAELGI